MATVFAYIFYGYLLIGFLFGCWFVFKGVNKVDDSTNAASFGLRLLWLPGSIALWPFLLRKTISQ